MAKNALMTCPVCRTEMPMAMFFSCEESARTFTRLALLSIPLGARVMRYLTLFTPPKTASVLDLMRLEIDDEDWKNAMGAIRASIQSTGTAIYVRVYERIGDSGQYKAIPLDLAAV